MTRALLALALLALTGCASLPPETAVEESTWLALQTVDGLQTAQIANVPGDFERESSLFIGREPSVRSTGVYFAATAAMHVAATEYMTAHHFPRWVIRGFEAVTIADSARCVAGNAQIGLRMGVAL